MSVYVDTNLPRQLPPSISDGGKHTTKHLIAKDEACRQGAVVALRHLAKQCGSQEALEVLLSHLVEVLNGSEGKLSTTEQRLGVLMGFGEVSCHVVTGASHVQKLSEAALKHLLQVLKSEVHEGTLLLTLKVMSRWCSRFTEDVPAFLVEGFQTGMGLKSSTSAVRYGYLQCMLSAFHGVPGPGVEPLVGLLLKAVERALSQPSQPSPVCEGLAAACLLLRLQATSPALENKVKATVNQLLDPQKQPFFADKFLQTASEDTYLLVLQLITRMILDHPDSSLANLKPFALPLLRALSHSAHPVRQSAQSTVKKLVSVLGGTSLACFLLREFPEFVETHLKEKVEDVEATEAKVLSEALVTICSGSNLDSKDVEDLALESLLPAHLPVFASRYPKLWRRILELLKLDLKAPVDPSRALPLVLGKKVLTPELKGAVRTLVALLPADTLPAVVSEVLGVLGQSELRTVTAEEHAIYTTPEGTLFNKAVLSSSPHQQGCMAFEVNIRAMMAIKKIGKGQTALNDF
ncbi:hypothetical protein HPB47_021683 [Ixodes persulcatus]|uniref:Uncharacterized protein n=1 Tax=Ixodes persulcatus TaxID=34615 RepID=A0AC60QBV4_IXOPE|nr:hypothetical protein HPB47_021683 [Ixodes persulcatus]